MPATKDFSDGRYECSVCTERKPLEAFPPDKRTRSGRHSRCRVCKRKGERKYQQTEAYKRRRGAWDWIQYGITDMSPERFDAMEFAQGKICAICEMPNGAGKRLCVDHDHATGLTRALLCTTCNAGLGQFKDDPALLRKAADYLEEHKMKVAI